MEDNKSPRLLISFVMDNSCTVTPDRLQALTAAFSAFGAGVRENASLEWEWITFDGFAPAVIKAFDSTEAAAVSPDRFPLLGRAAMTAVDRLSARVAALKEQGCTVHRPWLFLLSDGFSVDSSEEAALRLDSMERNGELLYLPFKMSQKLTTDRLQYLDRNKHMIEIRQEGGLEGFFAFVTRMVEQRATLPADVGIKFAKPDFEGWAEL